MSLVVKLLDNNAAVELVRSVEEVVLVTLVNDLNARLSNTLAYEVILNDLCTFAGDLLIDGSVTSLLVSVTVNGNLVLSVSKNVLDVVIEVSLLTYAELSAVAVEVESSRSRNCNILVNYVRSLSLKGSDLILKSSVLCLKSVYAILECVVLIKSERKRNYYRSN